MVAAVLAMAAVADGAAMIGISFSGGGGGDPGGLVDVTMPAGLLPQAFWNNEAGASGGAANLVDSDGNPTTAGLSWMSNNTWGRSTLTGDGDQQLSAMYLDGARGFPASLTITTLTPGMFDVYIYARRNEDPGGNLSLLDEGSDYTLNGVTKLGFTGNVNPSAGTWVDATTATATAPGNYFLFEDVNIGAGATLSLTANSPAANNSFRSPIDGIQVVPVPEPASLALLGPGVLALLAWRRFRRS